MDTLPLPFLAPATHPTPRPRSGVQLELVGNVIVLLRGHLCLEAEQSFSSWKTDTGVATESSMTMLFSLIVSWTCETYLSALCQVEVFSNRTNDVRKCVRFQVIQVLWDARSTFVWCSGVAGEIVAHRGNNFPFGPSLDVSCVRNDGHFDVPARIL